MKMRLLPLPVALLVVLCLALRAGRAQEGSVAPEFLITPQGVGGLVVGTPLPQALAELTKRGFTVKPNDSFMVDVSALEVLKDGRRQFVLIWPTGEPKELVDVILVTDPAYRTADGIGPGSKLADAVAQYGRPTVNYSTMNESREYCFFNNWAGGGEVSFRVSAPVGKAGIYPQPEKEYNETFKYKADAVIDAVEISPTLGC